MDNFANKTIALVGNAQSLLKNNYGPLINTYDIVCRYNRGVNIINQSAQGTRTDVAFYSPPSNYADIETNALVVHVTPKHRNIEYNKQFVHIPEHYTQMSMDRPSTGAISINWLLSCSTASITLFGFDFKDTPTYYDTNRSHEPHDYNAEKTYVLDLVDRGLLKYIA